MSRLEMVTTAPFRLFFSGADDPSWRNLLLTEDIPWVSIGFANLVKRLPKTKPYDVAERYAGDTEILLDSGVHGGGDPKKDWQSIAEKYLDFIEHNEDRLSIISEFDAYSLGADWTNGMRREFFDRLPVEKFMAVWHAEYGLNELDRLSERYQRVAVVGSELKDAPQLVGRLNSAVMKYGVQLHAISVADPDVFNSVRFSTASTSSWYSPTVHGETIVWDGHHLKRYPSKMKDETRKRLRRLFERAGYDADKIIADDSNEVLRFTLWSWMQLCDHISMRRGERPAEPFVGGDLSTMSPEEDDAPFADLTDREVDRWGSGERNTLPVPVEVRKTLPVFEQEIVRVASEQGEEAQTISVPRLASLSVRGCDSCHLSTRCPEFEPGSACKFEIPIQIRNREQLSASMQGMVEMQFQRIAGARFAEEIEGGIINPDLSREIDRFFKMIKTMKEIQENREFMSITVEAKGAGGIMSRLFGEVAQQSRGELPAGPMTVEQTDQFLHDVVDADVVEDDE